jgi:hypothetical protein
MRTRVDWLDDLTGIRHLVLVAIHAVAQKCFGDEMTRTG